MLLILFIALFIWLLVTGILSLSSHTLLAIVAVCAVILVVMKKG